MQTVGEETVCRGVYINDSISVNLGICNTGGIGNNELVVAVQR